MEDVLLKMPTSDVAFIQQMASRFGWTIENRANVIDKFIAACSRSNQRLEDVDIMEEIKAVRYKA
ncbi:MAG: hypothetical protein KBT06_02930 [Prevotellaceae bacterium]|nr:hypothetical protein [Candidatus Colivivens equi]